MPDAELPANTIPAWAATIIANVAEIKTRTERLPVIERELDDMRGRQVPLSEHTALQNRTNTLWDNYNRVQGQVKLMGWVFGVIQMLLAAGLLGRIIHLIP